jgi:hypothetical protein
VKVTAAHIARGRPVSYHFGPIAWALHDRLHNRVIVQIVYGEAFLCLDGRRHWVRLPLRVRDFIDRFNARLPVRPFTFRIHLPADLLKPARSRACRRAA